jgi:hypothetical protein
MLDSPIAAQRPCRVRAVGETVNLSPATFHNAIMAALPSSAFTLRPHKSP